MLIADIFQIKPDAEYAPDTVGRDITRFLIMEARLLDVEDYPGWFDLMADDIHYWVPVSQNRQISDRGGVVAEGRMSYFDDHYQDLQRRVERFKQPTAWTENPRIRHVHLVSNIEAYTTEKTDEFLVQSVIINYRSSREIDVDSIFGRRQDILRVHGSSFKIAKRTVLLSQNVLLTKNINTFF